MANKPVKKAVAENKATVSTPVVENKQKRIKIAGNAMVLTSTLKFATIQKMEKYNNNALCLVEINGEEEKEVFRISTGKFSGISKYGMTFAEANKDGYAVATILFPENVTDKKAYIKDNFGTALFMLADLEAAVETSCAELEAAYAKLDDDIEEV